MIYSWGITSKLAIAVKKSEVLIAFDGKAKLTKGIWTIICSVFIKVHIKDTAIFKRNFTRKESATVRPSVAAMASDAYPSPRKAKSSPI